MHNGTISWISDSADHKSARLGSATLTMTRSILNYGRGDRRNGPQWFARVTTPEADSGRTMVSGKRDAIRLLREYA